MKLTPLDIRHKEFKRGMRGYADVEVDEFLDEVADEYERLFKENIDLRDRVEALEEKVAGYKRIEDTLQKTLVNAQASAEEQKQNASKQGQLILQDAELKARQMVNEAYSERQAIEQSIAKLKNADQDFRFKFRQMLDGYLQQIGDAPPTDAHAPRVDFTRHAEAIKEAIAREAAEPAAAPQPVERRPLEPATRDVAAVVSDTPPEPAVPVEPVVATAPDEPPAAVEPVGERQPPAEVEVTMSHEPAPTQAETTVSHGAAPVAEPTEPEQEAAPASARERILFGESDDLLADVDSGVNEDEFKW